MNLLYLKNPSPPEVIYAIIEVPKRSKNKYEYNHELARVCHSSFVALANYGFVSETWTQDEAPLDILVLTQEPLFTGVVAEVKPIGILETIAEGREDPWSGKEKAEQKILNAIKEFKKLQG